MNSSACLSAGDTRREDLGFWERLIGTGEGITSQDRSGPRQCKGAGGAHHGQESGKGLGEEAQGFTG